MRIVEFLLARIGEDEEVAKLAAEHVAPFYIYADGVVGQADGEWDDGTPHLRNRHTDYTLMYDPARVLAECAAKRAMIEAATSWEHEFNPSAYYACRAYKLKEDTWKVLKISEGKCNCGVTQQRNAILKPLAAVYADHEDYQQKWGLVLPMSGKNAGSVDRTGLNR